jgi:signal transduction histidine kinase
MGNLKRTVPPMDLFIDNDELFRLRQLLPSCTDRLHSEVQLQLAWHVRQRNSSEALQLCDDIEQNLILGKADSAKKVATIARINLIRGEVESLFGRLEAAVIAGQRALEDFRAQHHLLGQADACWLLAGLCREQGRLPEEAGYLQQCRQFAELAHDHIRSEIALICMRRTIVQSGMDPAEQEWVADYEQKTRHPNRAYQTWLLDFLGSQALQRGDFLRAVGFFERSAEAANASGQVSRRVVATLNLSVCFISMNDFQAALDSQQRALEIARPYKWPLAIGMCLSEVGMVLLKMGKLDSALAQLTEAKKTLHSLSNSRCYKIVLSHLAQVLAELGDYDRALGIYEDLIRDPWILSKKQFHAHALLGQALVFLRQYKKSLAVNSALQALQIARELKELDLIIECLSCLAHTHAGSVQNAPTAMPGQNQELDYLLEAVTVAGQIHGYVLPCDIFERIAAAYAAAGDAAQAYQFSLKANASREKMHNKDVANRALSLEVRLQTERSLIEAENAKVLALEHAQRAEMLQQHSETLLKLGAIGQQITTQLNVDAIYEVLSLHVRGLLNADHFGIGLIDSSGRYLNRNYAIDKSGRLPDRIVDLQNEKLYSARCVKWRREILVGESEEEPETHVPGTPLMESLIFAPLIVYDRVIGVITVQSREKNAYGEKELLIFRTIAAYGAIALDNAQAYDKLKATQLHLIEQEKMAALGSLVAGVAHEMNTPIGNSLLIASTLSEEVEKLEQAFLQQNMRRSDLHNYIRDSKEGLNVIIRGLGSAAELVSSFKQVAVDQTSEQKREFDLGLICDDILASIRARLAKSGHHLRLEVPANIRMFSYPGPLGQVLLNLIDNAMIHGFEDRSQGEICLRANQVSEREVRIEVSDNGNGISERNLKHIFEPFFTTRLGKGGSGLGLSISYNIVTTILRGEIKVHSAPEEGTCFSLRLPLRVPDSEVS